MQKELTPAMLDVLRWLFKHPGLRIGWTKSKTHRPAFTAWWESEAARQHMIGVCKDLLDDYEIEKRMTARLGRNGGGTPDLTRSTFFALLRRGLIRAVEKRVPIKGMTDMYYYQLSAEGKQAATGLTLMKPTAA
jgi:hypothetical protein